MAILHDRKIRATLISTELQSCCAGVRCYDGRSECQDDEQNRTPATQFTLGIDGTILFNNVKEKVRGYWAGSSVVVTPALQPESS